MTTARLTDAEREFIPLTEPQIRKLAMPLINYRDWHGAVSTAQCEAIYEAVALLIAAETRSLHAEIRAQRDARLANEAELRRADEMLGTLRAEVERLSVNDARYRWLRSETGHKQQLPRYYLNDALDAAIDAARTPHNTEGDGHG